MLLSGKKNKKKYEGYYRKKKMWMTAIFNKPRRFRKWDSYHIVLREVGAREHRSVSLSRYKPVLLFKRSKQW